MIGCLIAPTMHFESQQSVVCNAYLINIAVFHTSSYMLLYGSYFAHVSEFIIETVLQITFAPPIQLHVVVGVAEKVNISDMVNIIDISVHHGSLSFANYRQSVIGLYYIL